MLKREEQREKAAYDAIVERRNVLRNKASGLRTDIRAELAERNKQRSPSPSSSVPLASAIQHSGLGFRVSS